jgi:hypothetical protein
MPQRLRSSSSGSDNPVARLIAFLNLLIMDRLVERLCGRLVIEGA